MEIKDDIVQIQDINGNSYSIPLEDIDGISIYSDKHLKAALSSRKNRFTLKYIKREKRGKHSIASIEEIPICRDYYDELEYHIIHVDDFREIPLMNICNIDPFLKRRTNHDNK